MDLYIIRHADAVALGERGVTKDADRPLSAEGEAQSRTVSVALQRKGIRLNKVLTSPLLRARQTAENMLRDWSAPAPELVMCDELAPGVRPRKLARFLRKINEQSVALVGHQPDLSEWAAWLIGGKKAQIDFAKSGVAYIICGDPPRKRAGVLIWLLTPDWLRG